MAVTNEKSTEITNLDSVPRTQLSTVDNGKVNIAKVSFTQGAAGGDVGSTATLCEIPARSRIIGHLSKLYVSALSTSRVANLGYAAHVNDRTGAAVNASTNFFATNVDVSSATSFTLDEAASSAAYDGFVTEGACRLVIAVTGGATANAIPAAATIQGFVAYVKE